IARSVGSSRSSSPSDWRDGPAALPPGSPGSCANRTRTKSRKRIGCSRASDLGNKPRRELPRHERRSALRQEREQVDGLSVRVERVALHERSKFVVLLPILIVVRADPLLNRRAVCATETIEDHRAGPLLFEGRRQDHFLPCAIAEDGADRTEARRKPRDLARVGEERAGGIVKGLDEPPI